MRRRWWLVVMAAVVFLGAAMPAFQPDDVRPFVDLAKRVADLERLVRANAKHSHNFRDLKDGDLFDATDGQVPVYNAAKGEYRPGSAGSVSALLTVRRLSAGSQSYPGNGTSTTVNFDTEDAGTIGAAITWGGLANPSTVNINEDGLYLVTGVVSLNLQVANANGNAYGLIYETGAGVPWTDGGGYMGDGNETHVTVAPQVFPLSSGAVLVMTAAHYVKIAGVDQTLTNTGSMVMQIAKVG